LSDWQTAPYPAPRLGPLGWLRILVRGGALGALTYGCLVLLLLVRLVEAPLFGPARPWTPFITQFVCKSAFTILRLPLRVTGRPMAQKGAVVANHASWLDIFTLNACQRVYFVSKSEVRGWVGIGWLARATGTVFIARNGAEAKVQARIFDERLKADHKLLFFPEGTSTDATRVLPFKSTLFAAFFAPDLVQDMHIQPVTVIYHAPPGQDARYYGWWGDMDFAPHLALTLATQPQGGVEVIFHPEVPVAAFPDRKALAAHCERVIRTSHPHAAA
jgi:1-acyl-sn-glycerol-3-phosphate acyltransferase